MTVRLLLIIFLVTNFKPIFGENELIEAVKDADIEALLSLINEGHYVNARDEKGRTALHYVAQSAPVLLNEEGVCFYSKKIYMAHFLLAEDADVNVQDDSFSTPLHCAAESGNKVVLELLLEHNQININKLNADGNAAIDLALLNGHREIVLCLMNAVGFNPGASNILHRFILVGNDNLVRKLLALPNVQIDKQTLHGNTALHVAIYKNDIDLVILLMQNGARYDIKNNHGDTAQDIAKAKRLRWMIPSIVTIMAAVSAYQSFRGHVIIKNSKQNDEVVVKNKLFTER